MNEAAHALPDGDRNSDPAGPPGDHPDWLVSSDKGAEDELGARAAGPKPEQLRLTTTRDLSTSGPVDRPHAPVRPDPATANAERERSVGPATWAAAASSIPKLKLEPAPAPPLVAGRPTVAPQPQSVEDDLNEAEPAAGFPDDPLDSRPQVVVPPKRLEEPFWLVALDELRTNPRVQILTLAAVLVPLLTYIFWPRSEPGISLHALKQEPLRWDGQQVRIRGRVGDVFHVGAGYAFNLHQGRDTIVVFTRGAAPRTRDKISLAGSVSTGYLDGLPRQAIFANP